MTKPMKFNARVFDESFLDRCDNRIAAFYLMWKSKCKNGAVPSRSNFDPIEMVRFLPGITLVDVNSETKELTYRLVGTNEVAVRGKDAWGNYGHVINKKGIAYDDSNIPNSNGVMERDETIFVPLSSDGKQVNIVMLYSIQQKMVR